MATFDIIGEIPGDQTNVEVTQNLSGYKVTWDQQNPGELVEVWQNRANNRELAVLVATVTDTYFDSPPRGINMDYHIWTRRISASGVVGEWDRDVLDGHNVFIEGVTSSDTAIGIVEPVSITVTTGSDTIVPSSYNTWTDTGCYGEFEAPSFPAIIAGYCIAGGQASAFSGSGICLLVGRIRLYNVTESAFVQGAEQYFNFSFYVSTIPTEFKNEIQTIRTRVESGFGAGGLIAGNIYRFVLELNKQQLSGSVTFDSSLLVGEFATIAIDSASVT